MQVWPAVVSAAPARFKDGLYDIYVAHRETGTAALLRKVRLYHDEDNEFDVRLVPGTFVRLVELSGKDAALASFEVRIPEVGIVPWVEFKSWGWRTFVSPREMHNALAAPRSERILGPFPAPFVDVTVAGKDRKKRVFRVRGAAKAVESNSK